MGSPDTLPEAEAQEKPCRLVRLTKPFYLACWPTTQAEYRAAIGKSPSHFSREQGWTEEGPTDRFPVECVTWQDAEEFCRRLSDLPEEKSAGRAYRLPTEAEWEYACRAGTTTRFWFGDEDEALSSYAWYEENSGGRIQAVAGKPTNPWGLYDLHGLVWEWCSDVYERGYYARAPIEDPRGPEGGAGRARVVRGGSCAGHAPHCRSAYRSSFGAALRSTIIGFRVAMTIR
jgi:formylglycine-generating enzyme required for sulfatase activity